MTNVYWAFVDYENTGSLEYIDFDRYQRIMVFFGANNNKLNIGSRPCQSVTLEILKITTCGKNNLDFHLAYHLGQCNAISDKCVEFHLYAEDGGYDGLIQYINRSGRKCQRINVKKTGCADSKSEKCVPTELILQRLWGLAVNKRPRNLTKLKNWLAAQMGGKLTATGKTNLNHIIQELKNSKNISITDSAVEYYR